MPSAAAHARRMQPPQAIQRLLQWQSSNLTGEEAFILKQHTLNPYIWREPEARRVGRELFARVPELEEEVTLWSGGEVPMTEFTFEPGVGEERWYVTSSYDCEVAEGYCMKTSRLLHTRPWMMTIIAPKGRKVLPLDGVSAYGDKDCEVLLPAGCTLCQVGRQDTTYGEDTVTVVSVVLQ